MRVIKLEDYLEEIKSAVFLIIRNDTIIYEKYYNGYADSSIFNIFSVTKALIATIIAISIEDGLI